MGKLKSRIQFLRRRKHIITLILIFSPTFTVFFSCYCRLKIFPHVADLFIFLERVINCNGKVKPICFIDDRSFNIFYNHNLNKRRLYSKHSRLNYFSMNSIKFIFIHFFFIVFISAARDNNIRYKPTYNTLMPNLMIPKPSTNSGNSVLTN